VEDKPCLREQGEEGFSRSSSNLRRVEDEAGAGELRMKETLEELRGIMNGVIGGFVIDETGKLAAQDLPKSYVGRARRSSKILYYVASVMKATRPFERVLIDAGNLKIVVMLAGDMILVVLAERDVNLPLLKLVSNMALARLRGERRAAVAESERLSQAEVNRICNFYDGLYSLVAGRLIEIFGEEAAEMFAVKAREVREEHPKLFSNLDFSRNGTPRLSRLKLTAGAFTREELVAGLEDLLVSMLETLKSTAGPMVADKTIDEIIRVKEEAELSL